MVPARRYALNYSIVLADLSGWIQSGSLQGTPVRGSTANLSLSGMALDVPENHSIRAGDPLLIRIQYRESFFEESEAVDAREAIDVLTQVAWVSPSRVGVEIVRFMKESQESYENILEGYRILSDFSPAGHLNLR